jgi:rubrerythrin
MTKPRPMTKDALLSAFGGESMAHLRYLVFSEIAEKEGYPNVSKLFKAIAFAEYIHAKNHYNRLRDFTEDAKVTAGAPIGPGMTSKNLELALGGELYEVEEMYPVFIEIAKLQGDESSVKSFTYAYEAEKIHAELYREAKGYVDNKEDWPLKGKVWICSVCGHTYVGEEAPERCPVCGAARESYVGF